MRYRLVSLFVVCLPALSYATDAKVPATKPAAATRPALTLRVLTYNIHHGATAANVPSWERQAKIIRDADADLVALQEVDQGTKRMNGLDEPAKFAELTRMKPAFGRSMDYDGGKYGNVVLTRHEIVDAKTTALPSAPGEEPRSVVVTTIKLTTGQTVKVAGTHLNHRNEAERTEQAKRAVELVAGEGKTPTLLAGDFNAEPTSTAVKAVVAAGFRDAADGTPGVGPTIPAFRPKKRIDYVFASPAGQWKVVETKVLDEPEASDHRPVLVVLQWVGN